MLAARHRVGRCGDRAGRRICEERVIHMGRGATAGAHPRFGAMIRDLIVERMEERTKRPGLGILGANHDVRPANCCPAPRRSVLN